MFTQAEEEAKAFFSCFGGHLDLVPVAELSLSRFSDGRALPPEETRLSISEGDGRFTAKFAMIARYLRRYNRMVNFARIA